MKSIIQHFILTAALLLASASASAATFYGKATVNSSDATMGLVAVSASETNSPSFSTSAGATGSKDGGIFASRASVTFYLYANLTDSFNYQFDGWYDASGNLLSTEMTTVQTVTAKSKKSESPTEAVFTARFANRTNFVTAHCSDLNVKISPEINKIGDVVTVSAQLDTISTSKNNGYTLYNDAFCVDYWTDDEGNIVSREQSFTVTIEKPVHYTAHMRKPAISTANGYYRIMSHFGSPLRICGKKVINIGTSNVSLYGDLIAICNPLGGGLGKFSGNKKRLNALIYDDPAMIIHMQGKLNYSNSQNYKANNEVLGSAVLSGQGLSTDKMFTASASNPQLSIRWATEDKYNYCMTHSFAAIKMSYNGNITKYNDNIFIGSYLKRDAFCDWRFQPINEEWADTYWFGACPIEEMYYDGGYWSSMYASFPFKCYEPDGVEAYIITEIKDAGSQNVAVLKKIESGIVPANTAVLLKSRNYVDTYDYFEHGKPIAPQNRLIPLEPDDASVDASVADGNLLSGTFNLFDDPLPTGTSANGGKWAQEFRKYYPDLYDSAKHRIFSVNAKGEVGFYVQANDKGDPEWEEDPNLEYTPILRPNRAYLDLTKVSSPNKALSMRLSTENEAAGIDNIVVDDEAGQADKAIYDIYGRRVEEMVPGNIYIVGGRKILAR